MAKVDFLRKRAESFFNNAKDLIKKREYPLAAFNLDQAAQLILKYYLFLKIRRYPKTHSLKELLTKIGQIYGREKEIEKMKEKDINLISDLEQAYFTSRYLPAEFTQTQVENMKNWVEKLILFLKKI